MGRSRANVSRLGGAASLGAVPIGRDKAKSRWFSKSKSICADSSGLPRDFALYGRRSAAGKRESCVLSSAKVNFLFGMSVVFARKSFVFFRDETT